MRNAFGWITGRRRQAIEMRPQNVNGREVWRSLTRIEGEAADLLAAEREAMAREKAAAGRAAQLARRGAKVKNGRRRAKPR